MKLKDCKVGDRVIIQDWRKTNTKIVCTVVRQDDRQDENDTLVGWKPGETSLSCHMTTREFVTHHVHELLQEKGFDRAVWLWNRMDVEPA